SKVFRNCAYGNNHGERGEHGEKKVKNYRSASFIPVVVTVHAIEIRPGMTSTRADRPASPEPISAMVSSAAGSPVESASPRFRPCAPSTGAFCSDWLNHRESRTEQSPCDKATKAPAVPLPGRAESLSWRPSPPPRIIQYWRDECAPILG